MKDERIENIHNERERERKKESAIASSSPDIYVTYEYIYVLIFTLNDILEMRMLHAYGTEMICLSDCHKIITREHTHDGRSNPDIENI